MKKFGMLKKIVESKKLGLQEAKIETSSDPHWHQQKDWSATPVETHDFLTKYHDDKSNDETLDGEEQRSHAWISAHHEGLADKKRKKKQDNGVDKESDLKEKYKNHTPEQHKDMRDVHDKFAKDSYDRGDKEAGDKHRALSGFHDDLYGIKKYNAEYGHSDKIDRDQKADHRDKSEKSPKTKDHKTADWSKHSPADHASIARFHKDQSDKHMLQGTHDSKTQAQAHDKISKFHKKAAHGKWFSSLSDDAKKAYKEAHPRSKLK